MEAIHKPTSRAWIDDTVINVRQFLEEWESAFSFGICTENSDLKSSISKSEYLDIEKQCSLDSMRCRYQELVEPADELRVPDSVNLMTLKHQAEDLTKRTKNNKYAVSQYNSMKYCNYPPRKTIHTDFEVLGYIPIDTPEVILSVQICTPERRSERKTSVMFPKMPSFHVDQEFLVLGCQYLSELRDKIVCISDKAIPGEYSECPAMLPNVTCKDLYKSGFFYINGVFYNDLRDKDCRDYSEQIMEWSKNSNRGIGPFQKAKMEKTHFVDLTIQLGYPYVYMHQGECEHLIIFTDLRVFSPHDVNNRNAYPMYVQIRPSRRTFCMVCHSYSSSWVVYDSDRLPENPFFFCKKCFFSFNYDSNEQKIGSFRAYHFPECTMVG